MKNDLKTILDSNNHLHMSYAVKDKEGKFKPVIDIDGALEAMRVAYNNALIDCVIIMVEAAKEVSSEVPQLYIDRIKTLKLELN